jgi:hypothetical protein
VVRYDIAASRKTTLVFFFVLAFVMFSSHAFRIVNALYTIENMTAMAGHTNYFLDKGLQYKACLNFSGGVAFIGYWLFFIVVGSFVFFNMRTKQQKIGILVQPATHLEKFLTRVIWVTVVMSLVYLAAVMFSDVLRYLLCKIIGIPAVGSVTVRMFEMPSQLNFEDSSLAMKCYCLFTMWLTIVMMQSVYVLAGTLLTRNQWLLTTIVVIVVMLVWAQFSLEGFDFFMPDHHIGLKALVVLPVQLGVTLFCYWRAYKTFCGMQVINNKWINV